MTAIVAGQGLGLGNTSLGLLGSQGQLGEAAQGRSGERVYVNAATGNVVVQQQDERLVGRGPDIGVIRTYNSLATIDGDNNDNWRLGFSRKIYGLTGTVSTAGSTVKRTNEDGSDTLYTWSAASNAYVAKDGGDSFDTLAFIGNSTWTWTDGSRRTKETYDTANGGRLAQVADLDGNTLTLGYNAAGLVNLITDANGEKTYLDYDTTAGKTSNVTQVRTVDSADATRTRVRYAYDTSNRLSTVTVDLSPADNAITDGKTYVTTYTYDGTTDRLASITQTDGGRAEFTYDASGRVSTAKDVRGTDIRTTSFDYSVAGQTSITDALGKVTRITYQTAAGQNVSQVLSIVAPAVGSTSQTTSFTYDADGNVATMVDARGNTTTYGYDANGNRTYERDAVGDVIERRFGNANELLNETRYVTPDPDGAGTLLPSTPLTTRYVYDAKQHLRFVVSAAGRITENQYNASGQLTATLQYLGGVYDLTGLTATTTLTESQLTTRTGVLSKSQVQRVDYTYDARGNIASKTTYASVNATTGAGVADGTQSTTNYVYDQDGKLLQTIEARGVATTTVAGDYVTTYTYDGLNRLLTQTDAQGNVTTTVYADATRQTTVTSAHGLVSVNTYDQAGNLLSVAQSGSPALGTTSYAYDNLGRQVKTTDATGRVSYKLYDEASRLVGEVDTEGALTEYVYNGNDQRAGTRQYATKVTAAVLTALAGNPSQTLASVRPTATGSDRNTLRLYDAAGRLAKSIDGAGAVTEYRYDGANRLTDTIAYATLLTSTQWTAIAALTTELLPTHANATVAADAANDRRTRNFYSDDGLLLGTLDAEGYLTEYSYDNVGQRTQALRYATQTASANWASGTLATLRPATSTDDQKSVSLYNLEGELEGTVDAEGYLTEYQYDVAGHKTTQIRYATKITYTAGNGVVASRPAVNAEDQKTLWHYDAVGQVTREEQQPTGLVTTYTYDKAGNVTQTVRGVGAAGTEQRTTQRRYDVLGRVTGELNQRGAAALAAMASPTQTQIDDIWGRYGTLYAYDAVGRRISAVTPNGVDAVGNKTLYYYDGEGQLTHAINALGEVTEYAYNVFGQRVSEKHYGTRMAAATLATLTGGLNTALGTAVSGLANASLDTITSVGYDQRGLITSQVDALGNANTTAYNAFGQVNQRTDKIDATTTTASTFTYDRRGLLKTSTEDSGTGKLNYITHTVYDAFGRAIQVTDANGSITKRSYDRLGRTVTTTDALSPVRSATYDAFDRVLTQTDALGNAISTVYDSANRKFTVTTPEGITKVTVVNRHGQTVSVTDGRGNTTTYAYGSDGQLEGATAPVVGTSSSSYDAAGRLLTTVDARGTTIQYAYDAADRVLSRTVDPTGLNLKTSYSYDAIGRVATVTDANGTVTQNSYDAKGQLTQVTVDPAGLNLKTAYTYDARGKTLTVTEGAGSTQPKTTQYVYDAAGRRTKEIVDPGTGKLNLTTTYTFDADSNVAAKTDGLGNVTRYAYDANNRLVFTVDATGAVQKNEYDSEGRIVRTTAYANLISLTSPSALATAASVADITARVTTNAVDQVQRYAYDKDGRLRFSVDAANAVTELTYDKSGNVIKRTRYANAMVGTLALGQAPAVLTTAGTAPYVLVDAAKDQAEQTVFDAANRATVDIDAAGYVTARTFDANGNVVQSTRYTNALAGTFSANTAPQFVATAASSGSWVITSTADQTTRTVYDKANRATFAIDAEGYVSRSTYDKNGRITQTTRFVNKLAGTFAVNTEPQVVATAASSGSWVVTTAGDAATAFSYDNAGRLKTQTDALGYITTRSYDAAGRLTDVVAASGTAAAVTTHYNYDNAGRLVDEIRGSGAAETSTTRYAYDGASRLTDETLAYGKTEAATTHYDYDAANRKIKKTEGYGKSEAAVTQTAYDAFGNAVKVTDPRGNAGYFYFDMLNRNVLSVDPEGYAVATKYNAFGTVDSITRYVNKVVGTLTTGTAPPVVAAATGSLYLLSSAAADQVTTLEHDRRNLQTRITDAEGYAETQTYDAFGNKSTFTNKAGGVFGYAYDRKNQLLTETQPVTAPNASNVQTAVVNSYEYDARGNKTKVTEAVGLPEQRSTTFTYDRLDRVVTRTGDAMTVYMGGVTTAGFVPTETRAYDGRGNLVEVKDASGARSLSYYDALNRKIAGVSPTGTLTAWVYNGAGDQTTQRVYGDVVALPAASGGTPPAAVNSANVRETVITYDALHRLVTSKVVSVQLGNSTNAGVYTPVVADVVTTRAYDAAGNVVQETDARGNSTYSYYDKLGRRTLKVDALRYVTAWQYDASGDITHETRYANAVPAGTAVTSAAVAATIVTSITPDAANDRTTAFSYDRMNRLKQEQRLNAAVSTVDGAGVLTTATTTVSTTYTYNGLGLVATKADTSGTTTFTYDKLGRQTRQQGATFTDYAGTAAARITDTEYNGLGLVARTLERGTNNTVETDDHITVNQYGKNGVLTGQIDMAGTTTYAYDKSGRISSKGRVRLDADGVSITDTTDYVYDLEGHQTQQIVKSTAGGVTTQLQTQETRYNAFGEISAKGTNGGWQEYAEYDKMGLLIRSNAGTGVTKVYFYDANGNATLTVDSAGAELRNVAYNQVTLQAGANLTISAYDARNQLTDTFSPTLTQIEHIQTAQAILNQKQSAKFVTGAPTLTTAAGLGTNVAVAPVANGTVAVISTATVSATLNDTYVASNTPYYPVFTSTSHALNINKPDTSAWGGGELRVSISLLPSAEMGLPGYYGDLRLTGSAGIQTVTFSETSTGALTSLVGRGYSYTLFKQLDGGGELYLGTFSGSTGAPAYGTNTTSTVATDSSFTVDSGFAKKAVFTVPAGGYGADVARVVLLTRPAGSSSGWTVTNAKEVGPKTFAVDWSDAAAWPRMNYEYRFIAIDAAGKVLDNQAGTFGLSDASPTAPPSTANKVGGDGRAFMDIAGNIHFYDQGADIAALVVEGAGATQTLAQDASRGPGWFVFSTAGLSGTQNYTVKAKNAAGTIVHQGGGSFVVGQPNLVTEPNGLSVQVSSAGMVSSYIQGLAPSNAVFNADIQAARANYLFYARGLSLDLPNTSALGDGDLRIAINYWPLNVVASSGPSGNIGPAQSFDHVVPSTTANVNFSDPYPSNTTAFYNSWISGSTGFDYAIYKSMPGGGEVLVGSFSTAVNVPKSLTDWSVNVSSSLGLPLGAISLVQGGAESILMYRTRGSAGGWQVVALPRSLSGIPEIEGRRLFDASVIPYGDYEYRQVVLDAVGNVLNTGKGQLVFQQSGPTFSPSTAEMIGGVGRVFMDAAGRLNVTEQNVGATSMTIRYRTKGWDGVWSNAFTLAAADRFRPGWFVFDPAARGMAASASYEYEILAKDVSGKELNHAAGSFTVGGVDTVTELQAYKGAPVMVHFSNVAPDTAQTLRLSWRRNGTADAYTTVDAFKVGSGAFDWDTSALEVAASQAYEFKFDALAGDGRVVARAHGLLTVGDGVGATLTNYASDATPTLINFDVPDDNAVAATATQMLLQYRLTGSPTYTNVTLIRGDKAKPFVLDASSLIPPGTAGSIDYIYTLKNVANVTLVDVDGSTLQVSGKVVLAAADLPDTVTTSVTDAAALSYNIRRRQRVNAFGETVQEIDANDRVTDFTYNTLGKLVQKQDPQTSVTLGNGFVKLMRPAIKYYYDALGRLVGTDDANGNRNTMLLAAGISVGQLDNGGAAEALVYKEFHADEGVVENGYDVFGLKRYTVDELLRRTDYTYDGADRLTQVLQAARTSGTYGGKRATDTYVYDAAGNRIRHTDTPDGTATYADKTYYDALGRVIKGVSAEGRTTTMTHTWDATLKGAGGAAVGGWKKTSSNALTGTKQNGADTSGTPATISATVDAVNVFGQAVSHTDLGGRVYTYSYNLAGWLTSQSSTGGQSIGYEYYANGYIKKTVDNVSGAWTEYGYDKVGNRTYEAYSRLVSGNRVYEQNAKISYDELNRVIRIDDLRADIRYEYDAQSNRRRVWSVYQDGVYAYESTQEYWYTYDKMNRFLVTRGSLAARATTEAGVATIAASGVDGVKVAYDKAGQRTQAIYSYDGHREDYTYTSDGLVENTYINATAAAQGALRAARANDLMGRVAGYTEYATNGTTVTRNRTTVFDKDNRQTSQTETYSGATTTTTNTLLADGTLSQVLSSGATTTTTSYAYEWWDSAKQSRITTQAYNPALGMNNNQWKAGVSHYTYDVNGHVLAAIDEVGLKSFTYVSNAQGQVMLREQRNNGSVMQTHRYYYAEGKAVGDVGNDGDTAVDYATQLAQGGGTGNTYTDRQTAYKSWRPVSSADFDQNYQAITASYPGTAPGSYVVQAGDSLYSIAASQWGDASLWYLIAEANGLSGASSLTAGQTLSIPNKVTNVHNSSSTSAMYDAGKTMGDTSPTIPDAPPPPRQDKGGCGGIASILIIIVAVVVTVYTAGAAAGLMSTAASSAGAATAGAAALSGGLTAAGTLGLTAGQMMLAAAVGGAAGSIASQGVAMAMGMQDSFSWKGVAAGAIGAGASAGIGAAAGAYGGVASSMEWSSVALRAAGTSVVTQGVSSVLGVGSFSWKGVAAAAAGAGASTAMGSASWMNGMNSVAAGTVKGLVSGGIQAGIFQTKPNWGSIAAQSFGSSLGEGFVETMQRGSEAPLPGAVAKEAETNPTVAKLYRDTVQAYRTGGIADDRAQELALRGFDLRNSAGDAQALDAYKRDVLIAKGASADAADAFLNYMGLSTGRSDVGSAAASPAVDYDGAEPFTVLPKVTVTAQRGGGMSSVGQFLSDWQDELAAVGTASQRLGQWMDDHPVLGWGVMAVQAASAPLLFAGQQALEHSPIGDGLKSLTGAAFEAATDFVDSEGAIGDKGKAALMTIGGIGALSLAAGGLGMLRNTVRNAGVFARELEQRRIALNFERDGGVDPHVVDPRILAQQRLGQMQQQFTPLMARGDAHFLDKHGPQTSLADQYERATAGWPNKNGKLVTADASRFFNPEDMDDAIRRAMVQFKANPQQSIEVPMGKPIGEGFMRTTTPGALPDYRQSNIVRVNFDMKAGLPYTAFPDVVRNGVTLPVPKF